MFFRLVDVSVAGSSVISVVELRMICPLGHYTKYNKQPSLQHPSPVTV